MRTLLILGRTSNLPTVWTNVLVGWFLCGGGWTIELVGLLGGISLLYLAGMTLNDAFDARWDRNHASQRPIPSGVISERAVWGAGLVELALGVTIVLLATSAHLSLVVALVAAIFLYNWLHKKWAGSVLIMGLCRALVYVSAGSAVVSQTTAIEVAPAVWIVAVAMILYIAGITLAARSEHLEKAPALGLLNRL
ncbi:MAG: UbiA family prenyltransferase, partial [Verrucomicrobiota bacterium]